MNDLVSYITEFDPAFPSRIEGATREELDQLEGLARRNLPSDYREFANLLGHRDGGLRIGNDSSTDVRELIAYYSDVRADGNWDDMIPENAVVIAYSGVRTPELCLELQPDGARVIYSQANEKLGPCADSVEKLAFRSAFSNFRRKRLPTSVIYEATNDSITTATASSVAQRLGFAPEWFSDSVCQCQTRGDALLLFQCILGRPLWLRLSSGDDRELDEVGRTLQHELGLVLLQRRKEGDGQR